MNTHIYILVLVSPKLEEKHNRNQLSAFRMTPSHTKSFHRQSLPQIQAFTTSAFKGCSWATGQTHQQLCVCWGQGVSGMNVVIKAFLSREPLEQHQSEGHGKRSLAHPTSWRHFQCISHKQLMFTKWDKRRGAYKMREVQGNSTYTRSDYTLVILSKSLLITLFKSLFNSSRNSLKNLYSILRCAKYLILTALVN